MAQIEVSVDECLALSAIYYAAPEMEPQDTTVGLLLDRIRIAVFDIEPELTQTLPGPDGCPNERVPADFFGEEWDC